MNNSAKLQYYLTLVNYKRILNRLLNKLLYKRINTYTRYRYHRGVDHCFVTNKLLVIIKQNGFS